MITNNTLTKNFLVLAIKTDYEKIKKNSKLSLISITYKSEVPMVNTPKLMMEFSISLIEEDSVDQ